MLINQSNQSQANTILSYHLDKQYKCKKHNQDIIKICTSHYCNHYKQLCYRCVKQDSHHHKYHINWKNAIEQAIKLGKVTITGLQAVRARKNQQMQQNIIHNPGLFQLQQKLDQITILLNKKIQTFRCNIKKIYSNHIKQKLDELDQIIQKSQQFLQRQIKSLQSQDYTKLNLFFKNDFLYDLKYYQSYFNQIFVKKIRSFKTAIENQRIFSLITNFQQNLMKIFSFDKDYTNQNQMEKYHLFNNQEGHCYLYYFKDNVKKNHKELFQKNIAAMNRISHTKMMNDYQYKWIGIPQSIFYPYFNCYYILGQGLKQSKIIVKYDHINQTNDIFTLVKFMQTQRKNFSVCILKGQIYIIGGQNQKDGCLSRCQKFVPLYNNQIYLIHSLRQRSSKHSTITYKNKYILKFGGINKLQQYGHHQHSKYSYNYQQNYSSPQIYSLQTQQWSIIPFNTDNRLLFHQFPTIFKTQLRNFIIILGGDPKQQTYKYRPAYQIILQQNKGQIQQMKVRTYISKITYDQKIYNSTIIFEEDDQQCIFLRSINDQFKIGKYKIET